MAIDHAPKFGSVRLADVGISKTPQGRTHVYPCGVGRITSHWGGIITTNMIIDIVRISDCEIVLRNHIRHIMRAQCANWPNDSQPHRN